MLPRDAYVVSQIYFNRNVSMLTTYLRYFILHQNYFIYKHSFTSLMNLNFVVSKSHDLDVYFE
jgi:hypothetical protein